MFLVCQSMDRQIVLSKNDGNEINLIEENMIEKKRSMRLYFRANSSELYHDHFMRAERSHLTDDYLQPCRRDTHLQVLLMNSTMNSKFDYTFPNSHYCDLSFNRYSISHRNSKIFL